MEDTTKSATKKKKTPKKSAPSSSKKGKVDTSDVSIESQKNARKQNISNTSNETVDDTVQNTYIEGVVESRGSSLHCCRPAFYQPQPSLASSSSSSSSSSSFMNHSVEPSLLLCGSGEDIRSAGMRTGNWVWNLNHKNQVNSTYKSSSSSSKNNVSTSNEDDGEITALAVSGDGNYIITGTNRGILSIWTLKNKYIENNWSINENIMNHTGTGSSNHYMEDSGFIKTGSHSLGAPIHTLITTPLSQKTFYVILAQPFISNIKRKDYAESSLHMSGGGMVYDWTINTLALNNKGTKLQLESYYSSHNEIFGLVVKPSEISQNSIDLFNSSYIEMQKNKNNQNQTNKKDDKTVVGEETSLSLNKKKLKKLKKESDLFGDEITYPMDLAILTPRGIEICALSQPIPTYRGQTQKKAKARIVPYPESSNGACSISIQPQDQIPGSSPSRSNTTTSVFHDNIENMNHNVGIATGHLDGKIYIWYGLFDRNASHISDAETFSNERKAAKRRSVTNDRGAILNPIPLGVRRLQPLHWHSGPVTSIAWSLSGYLLSGGHEAVLLVWRLNLNNSSNGNSHIATGVIGKPEFLPRLGGSVSHISLSLDHNSASVSTTNNVIRLISLSNRERVFALKGISLSLGLHNKNNKSSKNHHRFNNNSSSTSSSNPHPSLSSLSLVSAWSDMKRKQSKQLIIKDDKTLKLTKEEEKIKLEKEKREQMEMEKNETENENDDFLTSSRKNKNIIVVKGILGHELSNDSSTLAASISLLTTEICPFSSSSLHRNTNGYDEKNDSIHSSCRVLINGHPGMIQFFDVFTDTVDPVPLEIFPQNYNILNQITHRTKGGHSKVNSSSNTSNSSSALPTPVVTHCCYAQNGKYLITVDSWKKPKSSKQKNKFKNKTQTFSTDQNKKREYLTGPEKSFELEKYEALKLLGLNPDNNTATTESEQSPNLKFWQINRSSPSPSSSNGKRKDDSFMTFNQGSWILNSAVSSPHGVHNISSLASSNSSSSNSENNGSVCLGATGALDGSIKIWKLLQSSSSLSQSNKRPYHGRATTKKDTVMVQFDEKWVCDHTIQYHSGTAITSLCFCDDNSILAVGCGHNGLISLWNPNTATLIRTLLPPFLLSTLSSVTPIIEQQLYNSLLISTKNKNNNGGGGRTNGGSYSEKYNENGGFQFSTSSKTLGEQDVTHKRKQDEISNNGSDNGNSHRDTDTDTDADAIIDVKALLATSNTKKTTVSIDRTYGVVHYSAFLSSGFESQFFKSSTTCSPPPTCHGSTKLFFATPSSFGLWDLINCKIDYSYFMTIDAATSLPLHVQPFQFNSKHNPNNKNTNNKGEEEEEMIQTASYAIATSSTLSQIKFKNNDSGSSKVATDGSCIALFSTLSSQPIYLFHLKYKVKSMKFVISESGIPLGITVLTTKLTLQFLSIKMQASSSTTSTSTSTSNHSSNPLFPSSKVMLRKPLPIAFNNKKVKFDTRVIDEEQNNNNNNDKDSTMLPPPPPSAPLTSKEQSISGLLKLVPSSELPQATDLFNAFFSSSSSSSSSSQFVSAQKTKNTQPNKMFTFGLEDDEDESQESNESDNETIQETDINTSQKQLTANGMLSGNSINESSLPNQDHWIDFFKTSLSTN